MFAAYKNLSVWAKTGLCTSFGIFNGFIVSRCLIRYQSKNTLMARVNRDRVSNAI